jgi:hypothetical protein
MGPLDDGRVVIGRVGEARVTFLRPVVTADGSNYVRVPILLEAPGLSAESVLELEGWGGWTVGLIEFFADMATHWRGWEGVKEWRDDGDFRTDMIRATHDGLGTIEMLISTSPRIGISQTEGKWSLELVVPIDPGALESITDGLRRLLTSPSTSKTEADSSGTDD